MTLPARAVLAATLALAAAPAPARAQFATTNVQVLQGWNFHDPSVGEDVKGGKLSTITVNHFDTWRYGDNFFFADLMQGQFTDGNNSHIYAELHPRLFLNRLLGTKGTILGVLRDGGLATELNLGDGFQAWLAGLGGDLAVPWGSVGLNVYYRYTALQIPAVRLRRYDQTWQVSPFWTVPFSALRVPFLFTGFVDVDGVREPSGARGVEVMAQPELMVDVLALAHGPKNVVLAGIEWYLHYHSGNVALGAPSNLISAPQALLQVNLH